MPKAKVPRIDVPSNGRITEARDINATGQIVGGYQTNGVGAAIWIVAEAVCAAAGRVMIKPDDLAVVVDAVGLGAVGGRGIVEGDVIVDWH